ILVAVVAIATIFYSFQGGDDSAYAEEIQKEREEKDHFMRTSNESPFAQASQSFKGLAYYPPDPKFKIQADLNLIENKNVVVLTTNDGKQEHYLEYAYAEFDLDNLHHKLLILEMMEMGPFRGKLFLAFGDETSALETYGAGRYLDLSKVPGSTTITLDFNKAYNPYCAYNDTYSCPLPPTENLLRVAIKAGEMSYH
ncbi:MAG: DUF1684 domain-containing protein, partial [Bacteroidota bacterium]